MKTETQTMTREDYLVGAVLNVSKQRDIWVQSGVNQITPVLADTIDDLMEVFGEGDIPAECRVLYDVFPELKEEWRQFGDYASERNPKPRAAFWTAFRQMEEFLLAKDEEDDAPRPLETIQELLDLPRPCTWVNICHIYSHNGVGPFMKNKKPLPHLVQLQHKYDKDLKECTDRDGNVEQVKLERLLRLSGGRKIIPDGWTHPSQQARVEVDDRIRRKLQERVSRLLEGNRLQSTETNGYMDPIGDETFLPPTRAQMDAGIMEGEQIAQSDNGDSNVHESDDPAEALVKSGEDAKLAEDIFRLYDMNPNVTHRSIADTLSTSVNKVKQVLRDRQRSTTVQ